MTQTPVGAGAADAFGGVGVTDALGGAGIALTFVVAILAVGAVLYLTYIFSRHLAAGASKAGRSTNIKVVDRVVLGQDRMLLIIKIGEKHYLIGSSTQSINILKELDDKDIKSTAAPEVGMPFKDALRSVLSGNRK